MRVSGFKKLTQPEEDQDQVDKDIYTKLGNPTTILPGGLDS